MGSGVAGTSAAVEASRAGAKVIVLEKHNVTGGDSSICSGNFYCLSLIHIYPGSLYRSCFPSRSAIRCAIPFSSPLRSSCHFVTETTVTPMETNRCV